MRMSEIWKGASPEQWRQQILSIAAVVAANATQATGSQDRQPRHNGSCNASRMIIQTQGEKECTLFTHVHILSDRCAAETLPADRALVGRILAQAVQQAVHGGAHLDSLRGKQA